MTRLSLAVLKMGVAQRMLKVNTCDVHLGGCILKVRWS